MNVPVKTPPSSAKNERFAFGDAVHAVLPFLKNGGNMDQQGIDWLRNFLVNGGHVAPPSQTRHYNNGWLYTVLDCWDIIFEMLTLCDNVVFEPQNLGKYSSDLLVYHQGRAYIIEIKSRKKTNEKSISLTKARKQIGTNAAELHRYNPGLHIYGYIFWLEYTIGGDVIYNWEYVIEYIP